MLASGDYDLMKPLFAMYRAQLDLMKIRARTWYGADGATMAESTTFWGMWSNADYGWKRPAEMPVGEMTNRFMWNYWFSGLELTWLMLEYYDYTNDQQFLDETLLPMAEQFLLYFDQRFKRDGQGKLWIYPAQALETWQDAENPAPDVAGLHAILGRLTKLPALAPGLRERWMKLQTELPSIPWARVREGRSCYLLRSLASRPKTLRTLNFTPFSRSGSMPSNPRTYRWAATPLPPVKIGVAGGGLRTGCR